MLYFPVLLIKKKVCTYCSEGSDGSTGYFLSDVNPFLSVSRLTVYLDVCSGTSV